MPALPYISFVRENARFLTFGLGIAAFSSFGQTFFIALFGAEIRSEFGLSHGGFGSVYSIATVMSAVTLIWLGRLIDRFDLRPFSLAVSVLIAASCLVMSAVEGVVMLGCGIYLLRLSGQGLMSHTAITSMGRYFDRDRGKAVSIANLGFPTGEAIFPILAVALIAALGWRGAWTASGLALIVVLPLMVLWLLRGHEARDRMLRERTADPKADGTARRHWSRREVLRDARFYLLLPAALSLSFIGTGIFFHQVHLVETKGWELSWFAATFVAHALATVVAAVSVGPLIDRISARRLFPLTMVPGAAAVAVLAAFDQPITALFFMLLNGLGVGMYRGAIGSIWAEIYGVRHLGAIRAMVSALMVFGSALSPFSMGLLIDLGVGIDTILWICLGYLGLSIALAAVALQKPGTGQP